MPALSRSLISAATALLAAGALGIYLQRQTQPLPPQSGAARPLLLAPMLGVLDSCILLPDGDASPSGQHCTGPGGSAAQLVEQTLAPLQPPADTEPPPYRLGYTLQAPLLQLFRPQGDDWVIDQERIDRLVRTVQGNARPVVLYLFSTHFPIGAPLEEVLSRDASNLLQSPEGPLPIDRYFGFPTYPWTFARTDTAITQRRVQATEALLGSLCKLPAPERAKIEGLTLLGELHHLFPNFEGGMGWQPPYRVSDYSAASTAGFREFLAQRFGNLTRLNQSLGGHYAAWDDITPPARDLRTDAQATRLTHLDSFAHGRLPVFGWAFAPGLEKPWVHIYKNGRWLGKTPVEMRRDDVLKVYPQAMEPDTGWRINLDFRDWPAGRHRLDVFLETAPGQQVAIATREVVIDPGVQGARPPSDPAPLQPQWPLPAGQAAPPGLLASVDFPQGVQTLTYNPLAALWHEFRGQQAVRYLQFFDGVVARSCFADTPRYIHQLLAFPNAGWDESKYAVEATLAPNAIAGVRLGVSLYGDATYGVQFSRWLAQGGARPYGITEFHPLRALDGPALQAVFAQHQRQGAQFLSFFMEPRWQGQLVERGHNPFSFGPENPQYHSDALYQAVDWLRQRPDKTQ